MNLGLSECEAGVLITHPWRSVGMVDVISGAQLVLPAYLAPDAWCAFLFGCSVRSNV
jgi:hypothetical protein